MKAILRFQISSAYNFKILIAEKKLYDPACDDSPIGLTKKQRSVPESNHNEESYYEQNAHYCQGKTSKM